MDIETLFNCARDEFNLPAYDDEEYRQFVARCYFADFSLRNYFDMPAVKCDYSELDEVRDAAKMDVSWDRSGDFIMVYPDV